MIKQIYFLSVVYIALWSNILSAQEQKKTPPKFSFSISVPKNQVQESITGRAYVMISKNNSRDPKYQIGLTGVPFWGVNFTNLKAGESVLIDKEVFGYPLESIEDIPAGEYYVQGFINIYTEFKRSDGHTIWMHKDNWEGQNWRRGEGNLYSDVSKVFIDPSAGGTINLLCSNVNPPVEIPQESKMVKRIRIRSRLLSDFWGQDMFLGATVLLPNGYDDNVEKEYPVNYQHGHFGLGVPFGFQDPTDISNVDRRSNSDFTKYWMSEDCPPLIAIKILHPCPYYDDSYAVNSPNVGPYDDAINQELIPYLEDKFRIIKEPYARILSGGSTGGWIALAQQVFHPDLYGGAFSMCADPVDFHYHQIVNIYEDKNAYYVDNEWSRIDRPNTRSTDGNIRTTMANENLYELVVGDKNRSGGQWDIWEAAFSPIGEDGYPMRVWDKRTGEIDHEVAQQWKKYDLHQYLRDNWSTIGPDLVGKLFLYTGDMDSFYLNNAMELLEEFLESTTDPYYDGHIEYGRKKPHCYGPRSIELVKMIHEQVTKGELARTLK